MRTLVKSAVCGLIVFFSANAQNTPIPMCDPLDLNSCTSQGSGEACFVSLTPPGSAICAQPVGQPPGQQNDMCMFINGCAAGLGCILQDPTDTFVTCAHYCDAVTGITTQGSTCQNQLGVISASCARLDEFYASISLTTGMCLDCANYPDSLPCNRLFADGFES